MGNIWNCIRISSLHCRFSEHRMTAAFTCSIHLLASAPNSLVVFSVCYAPFPTVQVVVKDIKMMKRKTLSDAKVPSQSKSHNESFT